MIADFEFRISDFGNSQFEIRNPKSEILADLHLHTVLSPCAEVEMIPPLIVRRARELGLGLIAITDHNAAANCEAVMRAAEGRDRTSVV